MLGFHCSKPTMKETAPLTGRPVFWAFLAASAALLWQTATVQANYRGNWTALFCTGALQRVPPELKAEPIYTFPNSYGYDGQFYHYVAHDPFRQRDLYRYIDQPGLRYRRILVPLLAWALAGGRDNFIHFGFYAVVLSSILLGTYWLSAWARASGRHPAWGLLFLATPAVIISADRMLVDVALAALTVAFLVLSRHAFSWRLWLVLACAALTRETGLLLAAACCAAALRQGRLRTALLAVSAGLPCAAWYVFVRAHTHEFTYFPALIPFSSIVYAALHPTAYPARIPFIGAIQSCDFVALSGAVLALVLGAACWRFWLGSPAGFAALLFTALAAFVQRDDLWIHLGRVLSPLLVILVFECIRSGRVLLLAPALLLLPRVLVQLGGQVLGVLRAVTG